MVLSDLLSITSRRNLNYKAQSSEPDEINLNNFGLISYSVIEEVNPFQNNDNPEYDSISIDGKAVNLLSDLTDEQIEAIMKIGYEKAFNDIVEIITTCQDISDQELIEIYFNQVNPGIGKNGIPERLHLKRTTYNPPSTPTPSSNEPDGEEPDIDNLDEGEVPNDSDFNTANPEWTVNRKSSASTKTIDNKITLKATSTDGNSGFSDFYYTIEPYESDKCKVSVQYLANGRILITGDNVKIVAKGGQQDNIILMGNNNYIDTNSGNDTVRVGLDRDAEEKYLDIKTYGNIIKTGDGDDYVQSVGFNSVNMGEGNADRILTYLGQNSSGTAWLKTAFKGAEEYIKLTSYTTGSGYPQEGYRSDNSNSVSDNKSGWSIQNGFGDCQFLSTLNSLLKHNNLEDYFEIAESGTNQWSVKFKNCDGITQTVKSSDIVGGSALGDKDIQIIEAAMRLLMKNHNVSLENSNSTTVLGYSANWHYIGKYILGTDKGGYKIIDNNEQYKWIVQNYNNNNISQISFGLDENTQAATQLGIYSGHAYALVGGVEDLYVDLVNPHDSNDIIRLDWTDFVKYFKGAVLIGDTYEKFERQFGSSSSYTRAQLSPSSNSENENDIIYASQNVEQNEENTFSDAIRKRLVLYS